MNNKKKKNMLPALAMAGPVSVWMILFVTIPMLYIIYISFMSRGVFGDVVYKFSTESYKTILNPTYFKVILKSLKAAGITTILCLLLGYPLAYIIAHKPKDTDYANHDPVLDEFIDAFEQLAAFVPDKWSDQQFPCGNRHCQGTDYIYLYRWAGADRSDYQHAAICGASALQYH